MSDWDVLAKLDPLWTVLSDPKKKFHGWNPEEFFSTGDLEAQRVLTICESHGLTITFDTLLDFGCGVGRMTRAFSRFFGSCTGIDVSETMVNLARNYSAERPNCRFVASQSAVLPFPDASFDMVFSVLVLQHLPTKHMILNFIGEFIRVVRASGIVVFQVPIEVPWRRRIQLRRRLWASFAALGVPESWLFKVGLAPIQINGVSPGEMARFLGQRGAVVKAIERYDLAEGSFHSNYYVVTKNDSLTTSST